MNAEALIGTVLGTCTLQRLIGQGGMGAVYLAKQSRPRRQVAVKVLMPAAKLKPHQLAAFLERFRRETDAAASLEHPNIMPVHEYGERDGLAYLVMPYISGGTLRDVMEREGSLTMNKVVNYLEQLAAALDFAHARGVIHRDIKPANMLLTPEGRLLLTDFGLVKIISDGQATQTRLTGEGAPVGTPDYMSPEQVMGEEVDGRADLYSLGVILYQMVTGTTPFQGETPMQIAAQQLHMQPTSPRLLRPDLPAAAEQVMLRAMAKRPADRYPHAQELASAFRTALIVSEMSLNVAQGGAFASSMPGILGGASPAPTGSARPAPSESAGAVPGGSTIPAPGGSGVYMLPGSFDPQWQTGSFPSFTFEQGSGTPTGTLPAANTSRRSTGLLSRTGMFPTVGKMGTLPGATPNNANPATPSGSLPTATGAQRAYPAVGFNEMSPLLNPTMDGGGSATTTGSQPVAVPPYSSGFSQMSPDLKRTSGSLAVPNYEQGNGSSTVKLTGPVKVVQVPVAGQPGQYVTGLLTVPTELQLPAPAKSRSKKLQAIALFLALVIVLAGGAFSVGIVMHIRAIQTTTSQPATSPTAVGTPNAQATAIAQATAAMLANTILSDPLDQNYHNWPISTSGTKIYQFEHGAYHISNLGNDGIAVVLQSGSYSQPIGYQLTMEEIKGNDTSINNSFGMIIRYSQQSKGNQVINTFYSFEVVNTNGGEYRFYKYDNGPGSGSSPWTLLWHQPFGHEFHIGHGTNSINTVKIFANGSSFTFTVNGKVVGNAKDSSFKSGTVGMLVNLNGTEVAFSNLLITRK